MHSWQIFFFAADSQIAAFAKHSLNANRLPKTEILWQLFFGHEFANYRAVKIGVSEWLKNSCVRGCQFLPLIRRLRHSPDILSTQTGFQGLKYLDNYFQPQIRELSGSLKNYRAVKISVFEWLKNSCIRGSQFFAADSQIAAFTKHSFNANRLPKTEILWQLFFSHEFGELSDS